MQYDEIFLNNIIKNYSILSLEEIKSYYNQPFRHYHNWYNIEKMIEALSEDDFSISWV